MADYTSSHAGKTIDTAISQLIQFLNGSSSITPLTSLLSQIQAVRTQLSQMDTRLTAQIAAKQDRLTLKTINGQQLTGTGNLSLQPTLVNRTNIKSINGISLLGAGNINISGGSSPATYSLRFKRSNGEILANYNVSKSGNTYTPDEITVCVVKTVDGVASELVTAAGIQSEGLSITFNNEGADNNIWISSTGSQSTTQTLRSLTEDGTELVVKLLKDGVSIDTINFNITESSVTYTVSVSAGTGGTASGGGTVAAGGQASVKAYPYEGGPRTAEPGYIFAGWYNGNTLVSTSPTYTFVPTGNISLQARFTQCNVLVVVTVGETTSDPDGGAKGVVRVGNEAMIYGDYEWYLNEVGDTFEADPAAGYVFEKWLFDGVDASSANPFFEGADYYVHFPSVDPGSSAIKSTNMCMIVKPEGGGGTKRLAFTTNTGTSTITTVINGTTKQYVVEVNNYVNINVESGTQIRMSATNSGTGTFKWFYDQGTDEKYPLDAGQSYATITITKDTQLSAIFA